MVYSIPKNSWIIWPKFKIMSQTMEEPCSLKYFSMSIADAATKECITSRSTDLVGIRLKMILKSNMMKVTIRANLK